MVTAHSAIPFRLLCCFDSVGDGDLFSFDIAVIVTILSRASQESQNWAGLQFILRSHGVEGSI